jgi:hypothetical protein
MTNDPNSNSEPRALDLDDAADAILGRWNDGENLSESEDEDATPEEVEETDLEEGAYEDEDNDLEEEEVEDDTDPEKTDEAEDYEDDDEEVEEDATDETSVLSDVDVVEISVKGENKQVSVKDLKRLYGQEASLTQKSQDLASQRKVAEQEFQRTQLSYQKMLERAEARLAPYSEMDMLLAAQQMDAETFAQLRQDARQAEDDVKFLREESNSLLGELQANQQQAIQKAATDCVRALEEFLPDWGNELYNDIRAYAVKSGLPQEQVDQYTDPTVIMLINKARLYDESKKSAQSKKAKAKVTKSKSAKTKVLSSKKSPPSKTTLKAKRAAEAQAKLRSNPRYGGDTDDIAAALMARWEE